jgi:hypothetical protein
MSWKPQITQSEEQDSENSRHGSSLPGTTYSVSQTGTQELEAPLSTKESDMLAIERVEALKRKEDQEKRDAKSSSIFASFRKSIKNSFEKYPGRRKDPSKRKDPEKSAGGYPLEILAEALEAAAFEGNGPLIASLLSLGANAAYSSVKNQTQHDALAEAAKLGHTQVVDLLISRGSTQWQIVRF